MCSHLYMEWLSTLYIEYLSQNVNLSLNIVDKMFLLTCIFLNAKYNHICLAMTK
jgi:hypothetical protein